MAFGYTLCQIARIRWAHVCSRWKCGRRHADVEPMQQCQLFLSQDLLNNDDIWQKFSVSIF